VKIALPHLTDLDQRMQDVFNSLTSQLSKQMQVGHTDDDRTAHRVLMAFHSTTQSHTTSGNFEAVSFNSEDDLRGVSGIVSWPTSGHSKTVRTDRFLIPGELSGPSRWLRGRVRLIFATDADGDRGVRVKVNDSIVRRPAFVRAATAGGPTRLTTTFSIPVSPGDAVHIEAYQDSGAALNIGSTDRTDANEIELELL